MSSRVLVGDCRAVLATLPAESVQCVVTSPPYWGLRDYGVAGQLGLEKTPAEYIAAMVQVFRAVRRVLRDDGTLWLNIGDSYVAKPNSNKHTESSTLTKRRDGTRKRDVVECGRLGRSGNKGNGASDLGVAPHRGIVPGLKPKDLVGIPWRLAFALQEDGWTLRSDIIWHKANPMPEAVKDRPTKTHEYLFLLSKSARYYYDADAITEPCSDSTHARVSQDVIAQVGSQRANGGTRAERPMKAVVRAPKTLESSPGAKQNSSFADATVLPVLRRNKRSVWTVATEAFSGVHFATFPPALIEPCILAGSRKGDTVLDPFGGAGTTGLVADRLGRDSILIELNPEYAAMARARIVDDAPLFNTDGAA